VTRVELDTGPAAFAAVEVGGSTTQTVVFDGDGAWLVVPGAHQPPGAVLAIAVPGLIAGGRVLAASNLGWFDRDPVEALGLPGPATAVLNDAAAAALGEAAVRGAGALADLVYIGLGTGVGGAVVLDGAVTADNLFGHAGGFGERTCACGSTGCLETVAAGWALPPALDRDDLARVAAAVARAIDAEPAAAAGVVVVGGGVAARYPQLVAFVGAALTDRVVEPSAVHAPLKSAAAFGLRHVAASADPTAASSRPESHP